MKKYAVVFDLDGTLLNTIKDLNSATNYALAKNGYAEVSVLETTNFIGNGIKNLIKRSLKGKTDNLDNVFADFKSYYYKNYNIDTIPYDGIYDVINYLKSKNIKLGVLSNKVDRLTKSLIDFHFPNTFSYVLGEKSLEARKPGTLGLEEVSNALGVDMSNIIYIGDSDVDVLTVKNANCYGIFVSYGYRNKNDLLKAGAQIICDSCSEIIEKLEVLL